MQKLSTQVSSLLQSLSVLHILSFSSQLPFPLWGLHCSVILHLFPHPPQLLLSVNKSNPLSTILSQSLSILSHTSLTKGFILLSIGAQSIRLNAPSLS